MGKGASSGEAELARQQEEARQARIRAGTSSIGKTFEQFDDDFYEGRKTAYTDFAKPQLEEQAGDARENLIFALARNGTMNGTARIKQNTDLDEQYADNLQDIESRGLDFASKTRDNVEGARADLVSSLQVTGDNAGAANAALNRAKSLATPEPYSPLGQLFTDGTAAFSQQAALEKAYAAGYGNKPQYNTGLFGTPRNAVTTRP